MTASLSAFCLLTSALVVHAAPIHLPGRVEAEAFDPGGEGVGYHSLPPGLNNAAYPGCSFTIRCAEGVTIDHTSNFGAGYYINRGAGEWTAYTVQIDHAGPYRISVAVQEDIFLAATFTFHIDLDGARIAGGIFSLPAGNVWHTLSLPSVSLPMGAHVLRVVADTNMANFDYVDFTLSSQTTLPTVSITAPANQSAVSGALAITANASSPYGIVGVSYKLDGDYLGPEVPSAPFSAALDTARLKRGAHLLTALARDTAGNISEAETLIFVSNPKTPLAAPVSGPPRIFFTDLVSGPKTGGENNLGAFVSIYGKNFGSARGAGTVTVGGRPVARYPVWGQSNAANPNLDMIVVQLGPQALTGDIVVHTAQGDSNGTPFVVRSTGTIYFIGTGGTLASPMDARSVLRPGDIAYLRAGRWNDSDDFDAVFCSGCSPGGTPDLPISYVGYPGETAIIDGTTHAHGAIHHYITGAYASDNLVFANLTIRGSGGGGINIVSPLNNWRLIGCDITSAYPNGGGGVLVNTGTNNHKIYGNDIYSLASVNYDCPLGWPCQMYSIYYGGFGVQSNFDIGWNILHDNQYGKGFQAYGHLDNDKISGLVIHDNAIYNNGLSGIVLGGTDGPNGPNPIQDATLYNNLIFNNGAGGFGEKPYPFYGLQIQSSSAPTGDYVLYNNTFYNNASAHGQVAAGSEILYWGARSVSLKNNIFVTASDYTGGDPLVGFTGAKNLFQGGTAATAWDSSPVAADPKFVDPTRGNFHLQSISPAIGAGATVPVASDYDGLPRPQALNGLFAIGAYEYNTGYVPPPPVAPVINSALTASGTVGTAFSYQITATNGPTSFNATGLPAGLSVNTSNGLVSGTPTAAGTTSVTISATNAGGTGSVALALAINAVPDTIPPTVAITAPVNGATVSGTITVLGTAADNVAVSSVVVSIDGGAYSLASGTGSWTFNLNTTSLPNGSHTLTAKATDTSGNTATHSVTVKVSNGSGGAPPPDATPKLNAVLAYPNPAVKQDPVIRAMVGVVNGVEITIFDASGRVVHSSTLAGAPTGILNGQYYYDYKWVGSKASGVYFAVIHGKAADGTIVRARVKFIIVN